MIRKYCKAYHLKDLRQFSSWIEKLEENEPELSDDDIVYLWDDFTVVKSRKLKILQKANELAMPFWKRR